MSSHEAGEMHAIWRTRCFIKQQKDTSLNVLGLKKNSFTRFSFKTQFKIEFLLPISGSRNGLLTPPPSPHSPSRICSADLKQLNPIHKKIRNIFWSGKKDISYSSSFLLKYTSENLQKKSWTVSSVFYSSMHRDSQFKPPTRHTGSIRIQTRRFMF